MALITGSEVSLPVGSKPYGQQYYTDLQGNIWKGNKTEGYFRVVKYSEILGFILKYQNGYLTGVAQTAGTVTLDFKEKYNWYLERDTGFSVNLTTENFGDNGVKYLVVKNTNTNTAIAISVIFNNALINIRGTAMRIYAQSYGEISFKLEQSSTGPFITVMFNSQEIDINSVT